MNDVYPKRSYSTHGKKHQIEIYLIIQLYYPLRFSVHSQKCTAQPFANAARMAQMKNLKQLLTNQSHKNFHVSSLGKMRERAPTGKPPSNKVKCIVKSHSYVKSKVQEKQINSIASSTISPYAICNISEKCCDGV